MEHPDSPALFGPFAAEAEAYEAALRGRGIDRGLIGPREADRLWDRHIVNCLAIGTVIADGERVVDVGSGAGLPGIPLALARPGVAVTLLEPLLRRVEFLREVVNELGLTNVSVVRGRAEEKSVRLALGGSDVVTSRAVAPLAKLAGWCLPLVRDGGRMVALKGASAAEEVTRDRVALSRLSGSAPEVIEVASAGAPGTFLVVLPRSRPVRSGGRFASPIS